MNCKLILVLVSYLNVASAAHEGYHVRLLTGNAMQYMIPFIAQQRVDAYRGYPYLYEGNLSEGYELLEWHAQVPYATFAIAFHEDVPVGCALGIPFTLYGPHFMGSVELFKSHGIDPDCFYYITDIIILEEHRGKSLATRLTECVETYSMSVGFGYVCFTSESHEHHPLKPEGYKELDALWAHLGYHKTNLVTYAAWNTIQVEGPSRVQDHPLPYWIKKVG